MYRSVWAWRAHRAEEWCEVDVWPTCTGRYLLTGRVQQVMVVVTGGRAAAGCACAVVDRLAAVESPRVLDVCNRCVLCFIGFVTHLWLCFMLSPVYTWPSNLWRCSTVFVRMRRGADSFRFTSSVYGTWCVECCVCAAAQIVAWMMWR
jgi:hypothetical protein